jgi:hypothetical protein
VASIEIRTCENVMACAGISAMWTEISNLWIRVSDNEWEISAIRGILSPLQSTVSSLWASLSSAEWNITDLQTNYTTILWIVNNHAGRITSIESDILTLQWQRASNVIRTCSDVMACGWITDLVNLTANLGWRVTAIEDDILTLQWQWASNIIRTCSDVMACSGITNLVNLTANLEWRVTAIENCCADITVNEWSTEITDSLSNLTFVETYFSLTETSAWVVSIDLDYSALMNCSNIMAELDWCSEFDTYITNLINATVDCNFIVWKVTWCTAFEDLVNSITETRVNTNDWKSIIRNAVNRNIVDQSMAIWTYNISGALIYEPTCLLRGWWTNACTNVLPVVVDQWETKVVWRSLIISNVWTVDHSVIWDSWVTVMWHNTVPAWWSRRFLVTSIWTWTTTYYWI